MYSKINFVDMFFAFCGRSNRNYVYVYAIVALVLGFVLLQDGDYARIFCDTHISSGICILTLIKSLQKEVVHDNLKMIILGHGY